MLPGTMRAYFYNALGSAPGREQVLALTPMAAELDRVGGSTILSDDVQHCHKIASPPPDHHAHDAWPLVFKASLALARALTSDGALAEAVVNPAPPRPKCEPPAGKGR